MNDPHFIVTIDVEADNVWEDQSNLSLLNLSRLSAFQELCNEYSIIPTYLLSYETLAESTFVSFIKKNIKQGKAEIGIHPHVWTIPPFDNPDQQIDYKHLGHYQSMLPENLLQEKLENIHNRFSDVLGVVPKIHRAGRWGLCTRTVSWLETMQYQVDSSVVPLKSYPDSSFTSSSHPDFYHAPRSPYRLSRDHILKPGGLDLVEFPTTCLNSFNNSGLIKLTDRLGSSLHLDVLKKILIKTNMYPLELRPFPGYVHGTLPHIMQMGLKQKLPVLNLMFHSSELLEGASPYSSTAAQADRIWKHIQESFEFIHSRNILTTGILGALAGLKEADYFASS
ncbi:MAG: hypothetical protein K9N35_01215 [Candidatus Marinimicrobia bacterium]|nr:hypothetical protein [Candidatus Neomarinimicrobiota bacterium]